jgi:hypothetical protein
MKLRTWMKTYLANVRESSEDVLLLSRTLKTQKRNGIEEIAGIGNTAGKACKSMGLV